MPVERGTSHFLTSGTTGSGKTTLIDLLLRSLFESESGGSCRALIYDAKQEVLPKLYGLGLADRVRVLHPFDKRCSPWDLASDISDPLSARQFAQILIPESSSRGESSFFDEACRDIIAITVQVLSLCTPKGDWTFRDLLLATLYEENLEALLSLDTTRDGRLFPSSRRVWNSYFNPETTDDRTRGNIRASLNARLAVYESIAAAWETASEKPFSLGNWQETNGNEILVLGNDEAARAAVDPINRALFQRVSELTLARPEGEPSQTWFFLDEVREARRLDSLNSLLLKGRSKGACVVLSFQDIEGLREVYGDHLANEIVANCNNIALLRTNSAETAEWAAQMFGRFKVVDTDRTRGLTGMEMTSSQTTRLSDSPVVFSGDLLYLPLPTENNPLAGYFRKSSSISEEPHLYKLKSSEVDERRIKGAGDSLKPVAKGDLLLEPWGEVDYRRLGIQPTDPSSGGPLPVPRRPRS